MNRLKLMSLILLVLLSTTIITIGICADQSADESDITIRQLEPQTVLYTIYRGEYQNIGKAIGGKW